MTDNERRFRELELKVWLRKLKREKACSSGSKGHKDWQREIADMAKDYLEDVVYSGLGGYVLASEKSRLISELRKAVIHGEVKKKLCQALFVDMDIEKVRCLAYELRNQVEAIMKKYKSHVEKGNEYEK